jgi:hypothetical protein
MKSVLVSLIGAELTRLGGDALEGRQWEGASDQVQSDADLR